MGDTSTPKNPKMLLKGGEEAHRAETPVDQKTQY